MAVPGALLTVLGPTCFKVGYLFTGGIRDGQYMPHPSQGALSKDLLESYKLSTLWATLGNACYSVNHLHVPHRCVGSFHLLRERIVSSELQLCCVRHRCVCIAISQLHYLLPHWRPASPVWSFMEYPNLPNDSTREGGCHIKTSSYILETKS